jgi:HTH-type transcriptional regulator, competence development regulator
MPPTALGDRLRTARTQLGWSLREAERRTGIHNAHLVQIENGTIARPDPNILWTLASAYGIEFDELMLLAGHVTKSAESKPMMGAALRALGSLTPDEQREVLDYMAKIKERNQR